MTCTHHSCSQSGGRICGLCGISCLSVSDPSCPSKATYLDVLMLTCSIAGGGPRICPAHVLSDGQAAYVLVRFCQRFKTLEARDTKDYVPVMRVGPSSLHGVKCAVTTW